MSFEAAFENTLGHERGYVDHPNDKGGETYNGVARNYWPKWDGWKIIDEAKKAADFKSVLKKNKLLASLVREFYLKNFWEKLYLDEFEDMVAREIFDTAVNQGIRQAVKNFQNALNILNRNGRDYPELVVDGLIGNITVEAYESYMATQRYYTRNQDQLTIGLLKWMNYYQMKRYESIALSNPPQEVFILGWSERI